MSFTGRSRQSRTQSAPARDARQVWPADQAALWLRPLDSLSGGGRTDVLILIQQAHPVGAGLQIQRRRFRRNLLLQSLSGQRQKELAAKPSLGWIDAVLLLL